VKLCKTQENSSTSTIFRSVSSIFLAYYGEFRRGRSALQWREAALGRAAPLQWCEAPLMFSSTGAGATPGRLTRRPYGRRPLLVVVVVVVVVVVGSSTEVVRVVVVLLLLPLLPLLLRVRLLPLVVTVVVVIAVVQNWGFFFRSPVQETQFWHSSTRLRNS